MMISAFSQESVRYFVGNRTGAGMYVATDRNAAVMNDISDVELPQRCWKPKRLAN